MKYIYIYIFVLPCCWRDKYQIQATLGAFGMPPAIFLPPCSRRLFKAALEPDTSPGLAPSHSSSPVTFRAATTSPSQPHPEHSSQLSLPAPPQLKIQESVILQTNSQSPWLCLRAGRALHYDTVEVTEECVGWGGLWATSQTHPGGLVHTQPAGWLRDELWSLQRFSAVINTHSVLLLSPAPAGPC